MIFYYTELDLQIINEFIDEFINSWYISIWFKLMSLILAIYSNISQQCAGVFIHKCNLIFKSTMFTEYYYIQGVPELSQA